MPNNIHLQYVDKNNKDYIADEKKYKVLGYQAPTKFNIVFYRSKAEMHRLDKSNYLEQSTKLTISGVLREQSSLINPSITIQHDGYPQFNYCYIAQFERYYFIDNITSMAKDLWRIDMTCDVLMSFKDKIVDEEAFVERSASDISENIVDTYSVPIEYRQRYGYSQLASGSSTWYSSNEIASGTTKNYIMSVQGSPTNSGRGGGQGFPTQYGVARIVYNKTSVSSIPSYLSKFIEILSGGKNLYDFLIDIQSVPYVPTYDSTNEITGIEYHSATGYIVHDVPSGYLETFDDGMIKTFKWNCSGDFKPSKEWMFKKGKYILKFQPFGQFELDFNALRFNNALDSDNIKFDVKVELHRYTGDAQLFYGNSSQDIWYLLGSANVFQKIPVSSVRADYSSLVTSSLGALAGIATGNVAMAGGVIASAGFNALNGIGNTISNIKNGNLFVIDKAPTFLFQEAIMSAIPTSMCGEPCYQTKLLSELSGFTKVAEIHLEDIKIATKQELENIEKLLKQGVIL